MNKFHNYLGLHVEDVTSIFNEKNISYSIQTISGNKDKEKLIIPRVIKITEIGKHVELIVTYFSDSL